MPIKLEGLALKFCAGKSSWLNRQLIITISDLASLAKRNVHDLMTLIQSRCDFYFLGEAPRVQGCAVLVDVDTIWPCPYLAIYGKVKHGVLDTE